MKFQELIESMKMQSLDIKWFYDAESQALVLATEESGDGLANIEEMGKPRYLPLPSEFEINEYKMMVDFAHLQSDEIASSLLDKLHGKSVFRKFKDALLYLGIRDKWFEYRDDAYAKIAIEWSLENGVELE